MSVFYINQNDCWLKKKDEILKVIDFQKKVLKEVRLIDISQVIISGRVTVTPEVFCELSDRKIGLYYLNEHGKYQTKLEPASSKNILLRIAQFKANFDPAKKACIARAFVKGKLSNYRMSLLQLQRETEIDISSSINNIKSFIKKIDEFDDIDKIRGYEGAGSAEYFKNFSKFIKNPEFIFTGRKKHPAPDPINAILSLGYTLLRLDLESAVNVVGFEPYLGYLHFDRYGRASLALDLMEEFRPLVVDSFILKIINTKHITMDDFKEEFPGSVLLTDEGRKKFYKAYTKRKNDEFRHPYFNTKVSYHKCFELQTRLLAKYVIGEVKEYIPLVMR